MADVRIDEVQTELEITEGAGALGPAEMKKILAAVMEHMEAQKTLREMRRADNVVHDHAYGPESES